MPTSTRERAFASIATKIDSVASVKVARRTAPPLPGRTLYKAMFPSTTMRAVWMEEFDTQYEPGEKGPQRPRYWHVDTVKLHLLVRGATEDGVVTALNELKHDVEEALRDVELDQAVMDQSDPDFPRWTMKRGGYAPGQPAMNQAIYGAGTITVSARHYDN